MPAPNLETIRIFGIVAISMQLVVIPFLFLFIKACTCPRDGFAGPEVLASFHSLLGSTSWYLPALANASDRHVTDVISVMSRQSCVMSAVCLLLKLYIRTFTGILSRL